MLHPLRLSLAALPILVALGVGACSTDELGGTAGGGGASSTATGTGGACVAPGQTCAVTFTYPFSNEHTVELRGDFAPGAWDSGIPMSLDGGEWRAAIEATDGQHIQYKFFVDGATWVTDPKNPDTFSDGMGTVNSLTTVACGGVPCPGSGPTSTSSTSSSSSGAGGGLPGGSFDWRSAYLYFVFVDRFSNGDTSNDAPIGGIEGPANYQGGDYAGLLQKIDDGYFDDLGVNALWLTVPMDNTSDTGAGSDGHQYSAYHGYWPRNLDQVEEHFGDLTLLKKVVDHAHQHDIKVLFDYAMNHVHSSAPVFTDHPDWFWPLDYDGHHCVCGDGCDWNDTYQQRRCWFTDYLPDWNFTNAEARQFSVGNAMKWITDTGIDGFRLDAVKHIESQWINDLRARVTAEIEPGSGQHFYMVGETFESGNRDLIKSFINPQVELDGQFDFPLRGQIVEHILRRGGTMFDLDGFLATNDTFYDPGIMSTFIGNHDLLRTIQTALDQPWDPWSDGGVQAKWDNPPGPPTNRAPYERMAVAFTFLLTTKGVPLLYYGDEIGMPGAGDPDNRRFMQWDGYSSDQAFLKATLQKLGKFRKQHPATWRGVRTTTSVTTDTYGYQMTAGQDTVYVALNRGDGTGAVAGMPAKGHDILTDTDVDGPSVNLPPRTAMVILPR